MFDDLVALCVALYGFDFDVLFCLVVVLWLIVLDWHFVICMVCLTFEAYGLG